MSRKHKIKQLKKTIDKMAKIVDMFDEAVDFVGDSVQNFDKDVAEAVEMDLLKSISG